MIVGFWGWFRRLGKKLLEKGLFFLYVQLFLTIVSLPILLWRGLPVSWLTVAGNLLFGPVMTLFVLFGMLVFFGELLGVPCGIFYYCLELITGIWVKVLSWAPADPWLVLPCPRWWVLLLLEIGAILVVYRAAWAGWKQGLAQLAMLFVFFVGGLWLSRPTNRSLVVPYRSAELRLELKDGRCSLIDDKALLRNDYALSGWVLFTLKPLLARELGRSGCDQIVIVKNSLARRQVAAKLSAALGGAQVVVEAENA